METGSSSHKMVKHSIENVDMYHLYRQPGDQIADTPNITILFTMTEDEVVVHALRTTHC
jgi:hypothetical protein